MAKNLVYDYRVKKSEASETRLVEFVYVTGKIIEKIGPILAINNKEFNETHVVKKLIKHCPEKFSNIKISGLSLNSKDIKPGYIFC